MIVRHSDEVDTRISRALGPHALALLWQRVRPPLALHARGGSSVAVVAADAGGEKPWATARLSAVAVPDGEALVAGRKRLGDADLETLSKRLDQQARPIPSRSRLALPCRAAACSPAPTPCCPAAHPGPT